MAVTKEFVAELAVRTAEYYLAINDSCIRHDEEAFYEEFEESMAVIVQNVFCKYLSSEWARLLDKCIGTESISTKIVREHGMS